jgi:hypothetical protein
VPACPRPGHHFKMGIDLRGRHGDG